MRHVFPEPQDEEDDCPFSWPCTCAKKATTTSNRYVVTRIITSNQLHLWSCVHMLIISNKNVLQHFEYFSYYSS
eukprot:m.89580 g.89580  ORF g.89580 m.89580 type:complete len:74 (-) comp13230_c0_seq1:334-555(-)